MAGKKKKLMDRLPMKLILLSVLAVILLLAHPGTGYAAASDTAQSVTTKDVTLLDPFELINVTVIMTETTDDDWWKHHHRHRILRSPFKPPL